MMNNFRVYIKENGEYKPLKKGTSIFPLNFGQLLDERLDEAYLHIVNSDEPIYKTLTEIKIELVEEAHTESEKISKVCYYIVANDKAYEMPVGSGKYKHEIYLIERTKLLEGICCQSLTFTNALGSVYTKNAHTVITQEVKINPEDVEREFLIPYYKTPILVNQPYKILSVNEMLNAYINAYNEKYPDFQIENYKIRQYSDEEPTRISITNGTENQVTYSSEGLSLEELKAFYDKSYTVNAKDPLQIEYIIAFEYDDVLTSLKLNRAVHLKVGRLTAVENQYPTKPWTVKDCIERVLDLAQPLYSKAMNKPYIDKPKYKLNAEQAEKYDKIIAPEFSMTQCNLREQLKVIGGYIHAEPRLGWTDADGVYHENEIYFDEYGKTTSSNVSSKPYIYRELSQDINQYCTQVDTSASNIVNALNYAQGVIIEPRNQSSRTLRTETINVRIEQGNANIRTDLPIYTPVKVECGIFNPNATGEDDAYLVPLSDITPYVFEAHEYSSLLSSYGGAYPYSKSYALYYTQGEKNIEGLFFKASDNAISPYLNNYAIVNILASVTNQSADTIKGYVTDNYVYITCRITYIPIYSTRFSHGKQLADGSKAFTQIYNQSENLIEASYYGENIKGVAQRLGNVEQSRTYILNSVDDIPNAGDTIDEYSISAVNTEFMPFYIRCTVGLTKDFNRISQYVGINSHKRVYEVSEREAYKRNILLKEYVMFSRKPIAKEDSNGIFRDSGAIKRIFAPVASKPPISAVISKSRSKNGTALNAFGSVILPVVSSAFGNAMVFTWTYKDNYSAGEQIEKADNGFWQSDVPYCDYYGRIYWYDFRLYQYPPITDKDGAMTCAYNGNFPINKNDTVFGTAFGSTEHNDYENSYIVRKDSREALNFNFEVEFVTDQDDLNIGSACASNCELVSGSADTVRNPKILFLKRKLGKFEKSVIGTEQDTNSDIVVSYELNALNVKDNSISFSIPLQTEFQSWAICTPKVIGETQTYADEDGNTVEIAESTGGDILISCNKSSSEYGTTTTETIYFAPKKNIYNT